jgi:large subunit ribosomal protein L24
MKLKKGDRVVVLSGKDRGKEGVIQTVLPAKNKVVIQGINVARKHQKSTSATIQAGIIDKNMPMDASNVAIVVGGKPSRIGYKVQADGTKVRIAKRTGEVLA